MSSEGKDHKSSSGSAASSAAATSAAADPVPTWTVQLTPLEQKVFGKVLAACKHHGLKTQVRVAGGWVRDKLLGRQSVDLDLALDDTKGAAFAEQVNAYLKSIGDATHEIGVIKLNPEQSKHLETATFKIDGLSIDVNNLRTETYDQTSRIPQMRLGTAEEDCLRRDFTINSMFYNLSAGGKVEDLSGKGLDDLKHGLIRTPLPPLTTFKDDPLRVLRAIRFAGRFGFRVDPELAKAASDPAVRADLLTKVSRERFGIEINKMLSEQRSAYASFALLCAFGLRHVVFHVDAPKLQADPAATAAPLHTLVDESKAEDQATTRLAIGRMRLMQHYLDHVATAASKDERRALLLASFLSPYYGWRLHEKGSKYSPAAALIVLNALKLPAKDAKQTVALIDGAFAFTKLVRDHAAAVAANASTAAVQLASGLLCRSVGADALLALDLAAVLLAEQSRATATAAAPAAAAAAATDAAATTKADADALAAVTGGGAAFPAYRTWLVTASGLVDVAGGHANSCWHWKPFVDGKVLMARYGLKGADIGKTTAQLIEAQIANPKSTAADSYALLDRLYPQAAAAAGAAAPASATAAAGGPKPAAAAADDKKQPKKKK